MVGVFGPQDAGCSRWYRDMAIGTLVSGIFLGEKHWFQVLDNTHRKIPDI